MTGSDSTMMNTRPAIQPTPAVFTRVLQYLHGDSQMYAMPTILRTIAMLSYGML